MAFNVTEFRAQILGDGARPNLFNVQLTFPGIVQNSALAQQKVQFMARSAQIPSSSLGTVVVPYFGREVKFAGNRTFPQWTLTIINDEDFLIRSALESWLNAINSHSGNVRNPGLVNPSQGGYTTDATVFQYGKAGGDAIKYYSFVGLFPTDLSSIDLDWSSNDSIEEYQVTFDYQYWTSDTTIG